ncbi:MAG: hypothetical protein IKF78_11005 [Atopobiaceae bacterium]|nr:hypothetical protein [Atopobiaceae bacterium]
MNLSTPSLSLSNDDDRARAVAEGRPSKERAAELRLIARKAIDASLELADELEAA